MGNNSELAARRRLPVGRIAQALAVAICLPLATAGCVGIGAAQAQPAPTTITSDPPIHSSLTDLEALRGYIDVPGEPVAVRFSSVPMGSKWDDDRVPGPVDYQFLAVIEYADAAAAASAAGRSTDTNSTVRVDTWYPAVLQNLATSIDDYGWPELDVTVYQPDPAWVDAAYVIDAAPNFVIAPYKPPTS